MYNAPIKEKTFISFYSMPGCKQEYMPKRIVDIQGMDYVSATCEHLGLDIENVAKKGRKTINVYARQLAVYLMAMNTHLSLNDMKHLFGDAMGDHTTVIHCREYIRGQLSIKNERVINDLNCIMEIAKNKIYE